MLFNSPTFILFFLPIALLGFQLVGRTTSGRAARAWLTLASLFFYGWWNPVYLLLLVPSILGNYLFGYLVTPETRQRNGARPVSPVLSKLDLMKAQYPSFRTIALGTAIVLNLLLLGYFKYFDFFINIADSLAHAKFSLQHIVLPLGISFFTFTQMTYLVDSYSGKVVEHDLLDYSLFVTFFPHLIAGPILHHGEILPQFRKHDVREIDLAKFSEGTTIFFLGLAKKVILADVLGRYADIAFHGAAHGAQLSFLEAWAGALSYTLQLYFDFSGYSDMAIGLGLMFGVMLPLNFNSPYRARSIIDFWRRWHMTLSRFLRDYLYVPLGGNRHGRLQRYRNLMITMLLGGLWHGAGWTYVVWGGLHGIYLVINHLWQAIRDRLFPNRAGKLFVYGIPAQALTLLAVIVGWVMFRAPNFRTAIEMYSGMFGMHEIALPHALFVIPFLHFVAEPVRAMPYLADGSSSGVLTATIQILLGFGICLFAPNLYQMSQRARLVAVGISFAFVVQAVFFAGAISPFLYFQF